MKTTTQPTFHSETWPQQLEAHFSEVYLTKMQGIPVINPNIQVELAVLNEIKKGVFLGAIVTPWFINLLVKIVDQHGKDRHHEIYNATVGQSITLKFPSGAYEYIVNYQSELGYFYTCALISDMHSIENHDIAIELAQQSVQLVFNEAAQEETTRQKDIKAISIGAAKLVATEDKASNKILSEASTLPPKVVPIKSIDEKLAESVSRRALFRLPKQPTNTATQPK